MIINVLVVALGSAIGGALRYGITFWQSRTDLPFVLGTLSVNLLGGLLIGMLAYYFTAHSEHSLLKLLLITGFCGGLTTFSTFSLEVMEHLTTGQIALAGTVALMHLVGSVSATLFGFWLAKSCFS